MVIVHTSIVVQSSNQSYTTVIGIDQSYSYKFVTYSSNHAIPIIQLQSYNYNHVYAFIKLQLYNVNHTIQCNRITTI